MIIGIRVEKTMADEMTFRANFLNFGALSCSSYLEEPSHSDRNMRPTTFQIEL